MNNMISFILLSTVLVLLTVSCNNDVIESKEENYPLVSGDTAAIILNNDTLWIPPRAYCYNDTGSWSLVNLNGDANGGDYYVILLNWFAGW
jgi:hypothetical protein|tara:strand:+ start:283 stop:555 length:273 start_codon:yes stop_codon:yes gene_type:complete